MTLPVIDLSAPGFAGRIEAACRETGFFYVTGHGVPVSLRERLDAASRAFFALPLADKLEIEMARGGKAWRGYFPVGAELTSGDPDRKEGLYFGTELPAGHPLPLHGPNLFPRQVPELRELVLDWLDELSRVARVVLRGVAESLGLDPDHFAASYTANPTVLFRIFHYPPAPADDPGWGVGEHTDYGLLTLLATDAPSQARWRRSRSPCVGWFAPQAPLTNSNGGLEVRTPDGWLAAPPIPDTFVCNIGDMLERFTGGRYHSTPHRVRNTSGRGRLSFPFFFDPDFTAAMPPEGSPYGEYLTAKVAKVFPELWSNT